jgi:anti-sigma factor RsiW
MNDDLHSQSDLYVVGALDPEELREYEAHLADCSECHQEVAAMRELAAELSELAAAEPPTELRASVLAQIARTPQDSVSAREEVSEPVPTPAPGGRHAAPLRADAVAGEPPSNVTPIRRPWATRVSAAVAAAAVVAAAIVGGWAINERNDARHEADIAAAQTAQLAEVLNSPDVQAASAVVAGGGSAAVVRSKSSDVALLVTKDLPELPSGQVYEAWTIKGNGTPVPAGTFQPEGSQTTFKLTPAAVAAGAVALTVEPEGGSDRPTTTPIVAIDLSKA